ncbi:MAG: hypothetical protein HZB25_09785 [Candidatus Eisenbacteria bacterium]|nr:hypothetical protein [Candidatus Eisenbacteria bacterium]
MRIRSRRGAFARVLLVGLQALLSLLLVEAACRILRPARPSEFVSHPVLNHVLRPLATVEHAEWAASGIPLYRLKANRQSWIHPADVVRRKPPETFRIFYVGDSFVQGYGPAEQSMPARVGAALREPLARRGWRLELVNTGTPSYSPILYHILVTRTLLSYSPDLIVLNVDMTDVFDDFLYRQTAVFDSAGAPLACPAGSPLKGRYVRSPDGLREPGRLEAFMIRVRTYSRFVDIIMNRTARYQGTLNWRVGAPARIGRNAGLPRLFDWCGPEWSDETRALVGQSMSTLAATLRAARAAHVRVVVTAVPHLGHFTGVYSLRPFEEVRRVCEAEGVPYLDSYAGMRGRFGSAGASACYIPGDMHFNPAGNRLWASVQSDLLRQYLETGVGAPATVPGSGASPSRTAAP